LVSFQVKVDTLCGNTWCPLNRSQPNQSTRTPVDRLVVLEEDQVSAYKSKSRYNRKQLRFSWFRYTPTEPIVLQPPMFPHHGKISSSRQKGLLKLSVIPEELLIATDKINCF
ncbi:hypothetical protein AMECASPLE_034963, partial [Ameca splendens]